MAARASPRVTEAIAFALAAVPQNLTHVFRAVERGHGDGVSVAGCVVRGLSGGLVLRGLVDGVTVAV